jgi:hypothetical protein
MQFSFADPYAFGRCFLVNSVSTGRCLLVGTVSMVPGAAGRPIGPNLTAPRYSTFGQHFLSVVNHFLSRNDGAPARGRVNIMSVGLTRHAMSITVITNPTGDGWTDMERLCARWMLPARDRWTEPCVRFEVSTIDRLRTALTDMFKT